MTRIRFSALASVALLALLSANAWALELDGFLAEIDLRAGADLGAFRADLHASFGVSSGDVDGLFEVFDRPADVYITLRIGELSKVSLERVVEQYRKNRGQGWGVIAKNLGIKPGSPEFHALKDGRLPTAKATRGAAPAEHGKGGGQGANKGKKGD